MDESTEMIRAVIRRDSPGRAVAVLITFLAATVSCPSKQQSVPAISDDELDLHPRCAFPRAADQDGEALAIRCAQDFLERNGYFEVAPRGKIHLRDISFRDRGQITKRRGMLRRTPTMSCENPQGFEILFAYGDEDSGVGLVVRFAPETSAMGILHQEADERTMAAVPNRTCKSLVHP